MSGSPPVQQLPPMVQVGHAYGGRGPVILAVAFVGVIITTFLIVGRLALRMKKGKSEGWHDLSMWLALVSWTTAIASTCLLTVSVSHGFGNHMRNLSLPNLVEATKFLWIGIGLATFSTGTSKASVAAYLLALQGKNTIKRHWAFFLYFLGISNILLNFVALFTIIYQCDPPQANWNPTIEAKTCYGRDHIFGPIALTHSSWTAFSDFSLSFYPIYIVYKLRIAFGIKFYLSIVMGLGLIATAMSFVKLHLLDDLVKHTPTDPMYSMPVLVIWGWVELWLVLIALSVPPIWPLVEPVLGGLTDMLDSIRRQPGRSGYSNTSGGSVSYNMPLGHQSKSGRGITETKDVMVIREAPSTQSLCSEHYNQFDV